MTGYGAVTTIKYVGKRHGCSPSAQGKSAKFIRRWMTLVRRAR
jgi:hypothetical protein